MILNKRKTKYLIFNKSKSEMAKIMVHGERCRTVTDKSLIFQRRDNSFVLFYSIFRI